MSEGAKGLSSAEIAGIDGLKPLDIIDSRPLSAHSEAFRTLRSRVVLSDVNYRPKIVLVTSALRGDGKTAIAISLVRGAAMAGTKTVLVGCDLRPPNDHRSLGGIPQLGIVEALAS